MWFLSPLFRISMEKGKVLYSLELGSGMGHVCFSFARLRTIAQVWKSHQLVWIKVRVSEACHKPHRQPAGLSLKVGGRGFPHGYYGHDPRLLSWETKEIPSCLIARLLIVYTRQLEILTTALPDTLLSSTMSKVAPSDTFWDEKRLSKK